MYITSQHYKPVSVAKHKDKIGVYGKESSVFCIYIFIHHKMYTISTSWVDVML